MNVEGVMSTASQLVTQFGFKVIGAILRWVVGRWLIGLVVKFGRALTAKQFDSTLQHYLVSIISVALTVMLVIVILGFFGIETTSFAALIAAGGVAIGVAWSGLLANFAIQAGGVEGTVRDIGLSTTTILTPDNIVTMVGNN